MKKQVIKRLGCLVASFLFMFVSASAFAEVWFENSVNEKLDTGWTVPTSSWTWKSTYGEFNNFTSPLTYAASSSKTMPGDVATISTTVKFTALDVSDLTTEGLTGVKGGLTVVEDLDGETPATNYYGLVSGKWTKFTAAEPDLTQQVTVTITISKNNDEVNIRYTAGSTELYNDKTTLDSEATATIGEVSYVGRGELASLAGACEKSVFKLTVPTIANATATVKANGVEVTGASGVYPITYGTAPIVVSYAPTSSDYMLVGDTTSKTISADLAGDTTLTADTDFNNLESKLIVAKIGDTPYDTVQKAVTAASADAEITLVAGSEETVTIDKNVTFKGADVAVGDISVSAAATLTIENGKYGAIKPIADASLVLKGGYYQSETDVVQLWCYAGFFAEAYEGSPYITQVVEGTIVTPTGPDASKVPVIAVEPGVIPASEDTSEKQTTYLAAEQANGQLRWVNYALGVDGTKAGNAPKLEDEGDADKIIPGLANGQVKQGTGISAVYKLWDGKAWVETTGIDLDDEKTETGVTQAKLVLKDATAAETDVVAPVAIGIKKVTPANALDIISVPFSKVGETTGLPLSQVLKLKNIAAGDKIYRYDATKGGNEEWVLSNTGVWVGPEGSTDPVVTPGEALWLQRADNTKPIFYFGGFSTTKPSSTVAKGGWALVANPNLTDSLTLDEIVGTDDNCRITVETGAEPKVYTYDGTSWGYNKTEEVSVKIGGKDVTVKKTVRDTTSAIAPGQGFWISNSGSDAKTLNWNKAK